MKLLTELPADRPNPARLCCVRVDHRRAARLAAMSIRRPRHVVPPRSAFSGFRFPSDAIVLAVRWYLRFGLSCRDVEELLTERGVEVDHVSIYRWVQRFTPLLADAARPCVGARGRRAGGRLGELRLRCSEDAVHGGRDRGRLTC